MSDVENNGQRGGITGKGFLPGRSGNPGGRPKGLASLVRSKTKEGKELVDLMLAIMRGKLTVTRQDQAGNTYEQEPSIRDRVQAIEWLADRGFGKAVEMQMDLTPEDENMEAAIATARLLARERLGIETIDEAEARQRP